MKTKWLVGGGSVPPFHFYLNRKNSFTLSSRKSALINFIKSLKGAQKRGAILDIKREFSLRGGGRLQHIK